MADSSAGPIEYFSSPWRFSDCAANECQKFLFRERLQQVTIRAIAHYFFSDLRIVYCSNVSEWNARIMLLNVQEKREAVQLPMAPTFWRKMERAPLACYFFFALFVSRAFATKASNRGSL